MRKPTLGVMLVVKLKVGSLKPRYYLEVKVIDIMDNEMISSMGAMQDLANNKKWKWEDDNILSMTEEEYPKFTLAKNKARFLRMVNWYKAKQEWLEVAPLSGVKKLFKQQTKELEGVRASKMDYEMELEMDTLTPSQKSYKMDELKMCEMHERMAVSLITRMQLKIRSGRR